eukprot:TRINITY_DN2125_c0_g1_i1.p1 TRINITY_DN2125_c0_g1~~TRINITY_DN2125_c0_g1_i1.p1  ORF type:complete len:1136 (-),score=255.64 TRINITY_DN2125_c0_g1_i1:108-3515(-)
MPETDEHNVEDAAKCDAERATSEPEMDAGENAEEDAGGNAGEDAAEDAADADGDRNSDEDGTKEKTEDARHEVRDEEVGSEAACARWEPAEGDVVEAMFEDYWYKAVVLTRDSDGRFKVKFEIDDSEVVLGQDLIRQLEKSSEKGGPDLTGILTTAEIRRIEELTNTKVQLSRADGSLSIAGGTEDERRRASTYAKLVQLAYDNEDRVPRAEAEALAQGEVSYLSVPQEAVSQINGRHGGSKRKLEAESGAFVAFIQEPPPSAEQQLQASESADKAEESDADEKSETAEAAAAKDNKGEDAESTTVKAEESASYAEGDIVEALFEEYWYKAKVISQEGSDKFKVHFDIDDSEVVVETKDMKKTGTTDADSAKAEEKAAAADGNFEEGDRIEALHKKFWYPATVLRVQFNFLKVRFDIDKSEVVVDITEARRCKAGSESGGGYKSAEGNTGGEHSGEQLTLAFFGPARARLLAEVKLLTILGTKFGSFLEQTYPSHELSEAKSDGDFGLSTRWLSGDELSWAIGKGGSMRRKVARSSGCYVEYGGRVVMLCGTKQQRECASLMLDLILLLRRPLSKELIPKGVHYRVVTMTSEVAKAVMAATERRLKYEEHSEVIIHAHRGPFPKQDDHPAGGDAAKDAGGDGESFAEGAEVEAMFEGYWYKAKILEKMPDGKAKVHFEIDDSEVVVESAQMRKLGRGGVGDVDENKRHGFAVGDDVEANFEKYWYKAKILSFEDDDKFKVHFEIDDSKVVVTKEDLRWPKGKANASKSSVSSESLLIFGRDASVVDAAVPKAEDMLLEFQREAGGSKSGGSGSSSWSYKNSWADSSKSNSWADSSKSNSWADSSKSKTYASFSSGSGSYAGGKKKQDWNSWSKKGDDPWIGYSGAKSHWSDDKSSKGDDWYSTKKRGAAGDTESTWRTDDAKKRRWERPSRSASRTREAAARSRDLGSRGRDRDHGRDAKGNRDRSRSARGSTRRDRSDAVNDDRRRSGTDDYASGRNAASGRARDRDRRRNSPPTQSQGSGGTTAQRRDSDGRASWSGTAGSSSGGRSRQEAPAEGERKAVIVSGLSGMQIRRRDLGSAFATIGPVEDVEILPGGSRARISFKDGTSAKKAVQHFHGGELGDRMIQVHFEGSRS